MNFEGWIPREMVLDNEAEAKIPPEYVVQSDSIANPPMIFYLIDQFMRDSNVKEVQCNKYVKFK